MAISFVGASLTSLQTSGNVNPLLPSGWQPNDIFICLIASSDNVNSTMPSGWIAIDPGTNNTTGLRTTTYYKIAVSGDINPTVSHSHGNQIEATILAYRGVDTVNPLDVIGTVTTNSYSITVTANSITTATNNDLVIFTGSIASKSTFSGYSGTPTPTERLDKPFTTSFPSTFLADFVYNAGSTGTRTATASYPGASNGLMFALKPATGTIVCITDPSNANIYIDGILQTVNTSNSIIVSTGSHTVTFSKAGYQSYTTNITISNNQTMNVCAILQQIVTITNYGIVICTTSNVSSCPTTPITCPITVNPTNYINFIATLNSISPINLTVNFSYTISDTVYVQSVPVSLLTGTNVVYAFPTNVQYSPNTIISLTDVKLS
jgi:hypothetical protein